MNQYLEYPQWQTPLAAAILEFDPQRLMEKLQKAEDAISDRMRELTCGNGNAHERRLLSDGLSVLRDLRKLRLGGEKALH